jgi:poly(3-hydroxybutyrate) depolymerase
MPISPPPIWFALLVAAAAASVPPGPTAPELRTASTHPMQYYVSLPPGWSRSRTWPVVMNLTGSGKDWLASATAFAAVRDARRYPFIIVTPLILTNGKEDLRHSDKYNYAPAVWDRIDREGGRCPFDMNGIQAVVNDVTREFGGEPKVFLTGFSAGGHMAVSYMLMHPDRLRAEALAAASSNLRCAHGPPYEPRESYVETSPLPVTTVTTHDSLPVRFYLGTRDATFKYLEGQRDRVVNDAKNHMYGRFSSENVQGAGHEPMIDQVLAFFASMLGPKER